MAGEAAQPETKYARVGPDRLAYQVLGQGPPDLVFTMGAFSHVDIVWEDPQMALFLRRLASFSRLLRFDRRGTGASDPLPPDPLPPSEVYAEELVAVMDATGSRRVALLATGPHPSGGHHRRGGMHPAGSAHPAVRQRLDDGAGKMAGRHRHEPRTAGHQRPGVVTTGRAGGGAGRRRPAARAATSWRTPTLDRRSVRRGCGRDSARLERSAPEHGGSPG